MAVYGYGADNRNHPWTYQGIVSILHADTEINQQKESSRNACHLGSAHQKA